MNLLGQQTVKPQESKGKKIVLTLLIISVILLIISIALIYILKSNVTKKLGLAVNGKDVQITEDLLIQDSAGKTYIYIEKLADLIGYDYITGGYLEYEENKDKGYIDTANQIIEYKAGSNEIYKITPKSNLDEEAYKLNNQIIRKDEKLYIALEDLNIGCNLVYQFSKNDNKIVINTTEYWILQNEKDLKIDNSSDNQRAISYNMVVTSNNTGKMGVMELNKNSIIGYKYSSMQFDEYSQRYLVSNDGKYGIISKQGKEIVEIKYESIHIINHVPLLYEVKMNNKYGVLDETGKLLVKIEYDKIGFNETSNSTEPALLIKNLDNKQNGIIVCMNNKYGIVNLQTGQTILKCELDKIYARTSNSKEKEYYVKIGDREVSLKEYLEEDNITIVTN